MADTNVSFDRPKGSRDERAAGPLYHAIMDTWCKVIYFLTVLGHLRAPTLYPHDPSTARPTTPARKQELVPRFRQ